MANITIKKNCPFCGATSSIEVDEVKYERYVRTGDLRENFGNRNPFERELIKTGICYDCQEKTFGTPLPEHEKEWGTYLGECSCCGMPIYSNKHKDGDLYVCPSCRTPHSLDNGVLIEEDFDE